jgi:hypothetical protein
MSIHHTFVAILLSLCVAVSSFAADDELAQRASWQIPDAAAVKVQVDAWAADQKLDDAAKAKIAEFWKGEAIAAAEVLERTVSSIAAVNAEAAKLVEQCRQPTAPLLLPKFAILGDEKQPALVRNSLRLYYGRWLIEHELYDEALGQVTGLETKDVIDPAGLLFQQSVLFHRFLDKKGLATTVALLLENEKELPKRYVTVAKLMEADLKPLKTDSLDEVARLMDDVERHLDRGRAGTKVRNTEDDIVKKLEKMIEEMEKQQQQQQAAAAGSGNNPSKPKPDSIAGGPMGPGNVDPKNLGKKDGWGNLPPRDRQEVLQELSKDLPAHYREVIEQYFRKLARDNRD